MISDARDTVVCVFEEREAAARAVEELRRAGFSDRELGVVTRSEATELRSGPADEPPTEKSLWGEGAATGVAAGAGVGILWALGIVAGVLPGIGPIVAGGILGSVLASAAGGAVVGGILGALIGLGIPEDEARFYESEVHIGRTLVTVRSPSRAPEAWAILRRYGAYDVHTERPRTSPLPPVMNPEDSARTPTRPDVPITSDTTNPPVR
jgi:hypothetical protein